MNPVQRALLEVLQTPANRTCADCRAPLRDNVHCAMRFGVFVCINCSAAHAQTRNWSVDGVKNLLKSVRNDKWSNREVMAVQKMGNGKMNGVLERYVPANWRRPPPDAAPSVRARWIEAKYVRRLFVLPDYEGNYACPQDLLSAVQGKHLMVGEGGVLLDGSKPVNLGSALKRGSLAISSLAATGVDRVLPTRLVDYFVTVGVPLMESQPSDLHLDEPEGGANSGRSGSSSSSSSSSSSGSSGAATKGNEAQEAAILGRKPDSEQLALALSGLEAVRFRAVVLDSYPSKDVHAHADCPLPDHIARFAFPEGYGLSVVCVPLIGASGSSFDDVQLADDFGAVRWPMADDASPLPNRRSSRQSFSRRTSQSPGSPVANGAGGANGGGGSGGGFGIQPPVHFSFVLTDASSVKLYATLLRVNEEVDPKGLASTVEASIPMDGYSEEDFAETLSEDLASDKKPPLNEISSAQGGSSSSSKKSTRLTLQAARQRRAKRRLVRWLRVLQRHNEAAEAGAKARYGNTNEISANSTAPLENRKPQASSSSSSSSSLSPSAKAAAAAAAPRYKYMILGGKALVLVSHYPFFNLYRRFLSQLYRVSLSDSPLPIERYVANFCSEVPLPPRGQVEVKVALPDKVMLLRRAPKNDLPSLDFSLRPLLSLLDVDLVLIIFECLLAEAKICLVSRHLSLLTPVAAGLVALLFPFEWQGAFIPVMPASMIEVLDAPVPFFVGVHTDALEVIYGEADRPTGVNYVFLDENRVAVADPEDVFGIGGTAARSGAKQQPSWLVSGPGGHRGDGYWRAFDKVRKQLTKLVERNGMVSGSGVHRRRGSISTDGGAGLGGGSGASFAASSTSQFDRRGRGGWVDPLATAAADAAFPQNEHLLPIHSFGLETGILELRRGASSTSLGPRRNNGSNRGDSRQDERSSRFAIGRQRGPRPRSRSRSRQTASASSSSTSSSSTSSSSSSSSNSSSNSNSSSAAATTTTTPTTSLQASAIQGKPTSLGGHASDGALSSGGEVEELDDSENDMAALETSTDSLSSNQIQQQQQQQQQQRQRPRRSRSVSPFRSGNRSSNNSSPTSNMSEGAESGEGEASGGESNVRSLIRVRPNAVITTSTADLRDNSNPIPFMSSSSPAVLSPLNSNSSSEPLSSWSPWLGENGAFPPPPPFTAPSMRPPNGRFHNTASYVGVGLHEGIGKDEPEIRYTFLRFFLFIFQGYERFVTDVSKKNASENSSSSSSSSSPMRAAAASNSDSNRSLFDRDSFLASDHLKGMSDSSVRALSRFISSQMFERFLQEFVTHDQRLNFNDGSFDRSEIRFFNEKILEKQNRSTFSSPHATPFLDDRSDAHNETFQPPPPSNWGLPDDGRVYNYTNCFPARFSRNLFGSVRPPAALVKSAELVRSTGALSAHALLHASSTHPGRRGDDQAAAAAAVVAANATPSNANSGRRGLVAASLKKFPWLTSQLSTMPSSSTDLESKSVSFSDSGSQRLPIPQGRPSGEAKRMEDSMKLAIPDCRARILNTSRGLDKFRGAFRGWRLRRANRDRKYLKQGILLQGVARRFLQVKMNQRRAKSLACISKWMHVHYGRRRRRRQQWGAGLLCRAYRGFRVWHAYQSLRDATIFLQSAERGRRVRSATQKAWQAYLARLRTHLFRLWRLANTSVVYRSLFWALFAPSRPQHSELHALPSSSNQAQARAAPFSDQQDGVAVIGSPSRDAGPGFSFLYLAIHEDEITKLWGELGIFTDSASFRPNLIEKTAKVSPTTRRNSFEEFNSFPRKLRLATRLLDIYAPAASGSSESSASAPSVSAAAAAALDDNDSDHNKDVNGEESTSESEFNELELELLKSAAKAVERTSAVASSSSAASLAFEESNPAFASGAAVTPWANRAVVIVAAGRLRDERRLFYERLKQRKVQSGMTDARRESFFKLFGIAAKKKRKQTLAARLWDRFEEADLSSMVVLATFEGEDGQGGGTSMLSNTPHDFMHNKMQQRIRYDVLATVKACLVSLQTSHRKLHPDKRALNKMRRKKKQFLRFISEHERAPSILARQKSFIEVAVSPRHGQLNHSSSKRGVQHSNRQFSIKSANGDHTHEKSQLPKADKDVRAEAKRKSTDTSQGISSASKAVVKSLLPPSLSPLSHPRQRQMPPPPPSPPPPPPPSLQLQGSPQSPVKAQKRDSFDEAFGRDFSKTMSASDCGSSEDPVLAGKKEEPTGRSQTVQIDRSLDISSSLPLTSAARADDDDSSTDEETPIEQTTYRNDSKDGQHAGAPQQSFSASLKTKPDATSKPAGPVPKSSKPAAAKTKRRGWFS